eukprot:CAMPEP_0184670136 /NCGR_PEP_ID=MMETSP0308-20130426/80814_1 /TAXON_ID=38269 /ORGANISM="Gloeochaete witrockiana, Strain SAG 46.84" /LENGTH=128 /DNA_ID=CAMNT_0027116753 /DNA_START=48 /DNA_END=434 /DNA_ORIENTATION=+
MTSAAICLVFSVLVLFCAKSAIAFEKPVPLPHSLILRSLSSISEVPISLFPTEEDIPLGDPLGPAGGPEAIEPVHGDDSSEDSLTTEDEGGVSSTLTEPDVPPLGDPLEPAGPDSEESSWYQIQADIP